MKPMVNVRLRSGVVGLVEHYGLGVGSLSNPDLMYFLYLQILQGRSTSPYAYILILAPHLVHVYNPMPTRSLALNNIAFTPFQQNRKPQQFTFRQRRGKAFQDICPKYHEAREVRAKMLPEPRHH
jgi:hypothetical protein